MAHDTKSALQLVWGLLLIAAGVGLFFRIPQVMPQIRQIESMAAATPFIYFCFYFMAVILIGGGVKKLHAHFSKNRRLKP